MIRKHWSSLFDLNKVNQKLKDRGIIETVVCPNCAERKEEIEMLPLTFLQEKVCEDCHAPLEEFYCSQVGK